MKRLAILFVAFLGVLAPAGRVHATPPECVPELTVKDNGNVVARFHSTLAECVEQWSSGGIDLPASWEDLWDDWEVVSVTYTPDNNLTRIVFSPA